jgi:hypothetical protein
LNTSFWDSYLAIRIRYWVLRGVLLNWIKRALFTIRAVWSYVCLVVLLSLIATIPVLQLATLGYMIECSSRISRYLPWRECMPETLVARRIVIALGCIAMSWLPVWYSADVAYTTELIESGGDRARQLRLPMTLVGILCGARCDRKAVGPGYDGDHRREWAT